MNREKSTVRSSFGAVSLAITVVSLVAFSTMAYSVYADYNGAIGIVGQQPANPGITYKTVYQGASVTVYLNVTIPNKGLYVLRVGLSCLSTSGSGVACTDASVTVPPGSEQTLHFAMTVSNPQTQGSFPAGVRGNLSLSLVPFASFNMVLDLSSLVGRGG